MPVSIASNQYPPRVTATFNDGPRHFPLPTGATLLDLAGYIESLGLKCKAAPLTISISFCTAVPAVQTNYETSTTRNPNLN